MTGARPFPRSELRARLQELAAAKILLGTSSWKYEGWLGQLYDEQRYITRKRFSRSRFDAGCLAEYAEVFPTVSVDAGFYQFPTSRQVEQMAAQTPANFRLSFKVTDEITVRRFPRVERLGRRAGMENPNFLNAGLFRTAFLGPLEPIREKTGVLMLEFSRFGPKDFSCGAEFVDALGRFLQDLPEGWQYAVEIRNASLLHPAYFEALQRRGVAHVLSSWTYMPPVPEQIAAMGAFTSDFFVARFLLRPSRTYQEAVELFSPYDRLKEPFPEAREAMRRLIAHAPKSRIRPSYLFVNNRLEGNALRTIAAALRILDETGPAGVHSLLNQSPPGDRL